MEKKCRAGQSKDDIMAYGHCILDKKGKVHSCTGTEAPYRPYGP